MIQSQKKGFTLIELLIVIAIVTILSVVVVLTLNPAQLLRQARDSTRISDLATLKSSIALYLADVATPDIGTDNVCYMSVNIAGANCQNRSAASATTSTQSGVFTVGGAGWVDMDFGAISSGSPLGVLPRDPVNNATLYYVYVADVPTLTYEVNADMESGRYGGGTSDVEGTDGGNSATIYEVGTEPGLDI